MLWSRLGARAIMPAAFACLCVLPFSSAMGQVLPTISPLEGVSSAYDLSFTVPDLGNLAGSVLLDRVDDANGIDVRFDKGKLGVESVVAGQRRALGVGADLPAVTGPAAVVIRRRGDSVDVLVDHALVAKSYTDASQGGDAGCAFPEGAVADVMLQPVDDVAFGEDFSWEQDSEAAKLWRVVKGEWTDQKAGDWTNSAAEARQTDYQSANLFAYVGRSDGPALVVTGMDHWSDYLVRVGARSNSGNAMGIAACYADERNFILFRMTSQLSTDDDADELQLILYRNSERIPLAAKKGGLLPGQWYSLGLRFQDGHVEALLDHEVVLTADHVSTAMRGKIGLYCEGMGGVKFDDVKVEKWRYLADSFDSGSQDAWSGAAAGWRVAAEGDSRRHVLERDSAQPGLLLSRGDVWGPVRYGADVDLAAGPGALCFNYIDEQNYAQVSWAPLTGVQVEFPAARLELSRVVAGERQVLGEATARVSEGGWTRLSIETRNDLLRVFDGSKRVFEDLEDVLLTGRLGIRGSAGAHIDDVRAEVIEPNEAAKVTAQFAQEDTMREWASVAGAWVAASAPDPGLELSRVRYRPASSPETRSLYWNKGDFYGDTTVEVSLAQAAPGVPTVFLLCADLDDASNAYAFALTHDGNGGLVIQLSRRGAEVAQGTAAGVSYPTYVILARRGSLVTASVGGTTVVRYRDRGPLQGTRIGVLTDGSQVPLSAVIASCSAQRDYTFSSSPTDWVTETGIWDITSRWTCSPQWTWFSGVDDGGPAVLWSKRTFSGDTTVDVYASIKMGLAAGGASYKHPNDINLTICGDGQNLASGYSVVLGGPLDTPTQLRRGAKILAQTSDPGARLPRLSDGMLSTNEFHRKWWQVRIQKQGPRIRVFYETKCILDVVDPEPLDGGHVALWTWDNGIMVARANIFGVERDEVFEPRASDVRVAAAHEPEPGPMPLELTSSTHPGLFDDFESGLGQFATRDGAQGASVARERAQPASGEYCLVACNENAGGTFGLTAVSTPFDAAKLGRVAFDYRLDPSVRVNLMFRTASRDYIVGFTGPERCQPGQVYLGRIAEVKADGQWHHAEFDLRGHLYRLLPTLADTTVTEVAFGQFYREKILSAGMTGNPARATYSLDNFAIYSPGGESAQFVVQDRTNESRELLYVVDRLQGTLPGEGAPSSPPAPVEGVAPSTGTATTAVTPKPAPVQTAALQAPSEGAPVSATIVAATPEPGEWWLHVRGKHEDGSLTPVLHQRFLVDGTGPVAGAFTPAAGEVPTSGVVTVGLSDPESGVQPGSVKVSVNGEEYGASDPALSYDPVAQVARLDLAQLRTPLPAEGSFDVALLAAQDYAGHSLAAPEGGRFPIDRSRDQIAPPAPKVTSGPVYLASNDFEALTPESMGEFAPVPGTGCAIGLDDSTSATGRSSLAVYCTETGPPFQAYVRTSPFDAGVYRVISFDYRFDPWLRADLIVSLATGTSFAVRLTDSDSYYSVYGVDSDIVADGRWRHTEIPIYDIIRRNLPSIESYVVSSIVLGGSGWPGNPEGSRYHLDNFRIVGVASVATPLNVTWTAADASGIAGASYVVDNVPSTEPDTVAETSGTQIAVSDVPDGDTFIHVRVVDGAGNWGPTTHYRCFLDSHPAVATASVPAADQGACTSRVEVALTDQGPAGVDPRSIVLSVAGVDYGITSPALSFNGASGQLLWDGQLVEPEPVAFPDGQAIPIHLAAAKDFAGNGVTPDLSWSFRMDYALDSSPPAAPRVTSGTHATGFFNPFEGTAEQGALDEWTPRGGTKAELDSTTAASGGSSLKLTFVEGNQFRADVRSTPFNALATPLLSFDYRIPPEVQVDLLFIINGSQVLVAFTDNETTAQSRVPGVIADGEWHHVDGFDISAAARQVLGAVATMQVSLISIQDAGATETPIGSSFNIDNMMVYQVGSGAPQLQWKVTDASGIAGYSYVVDDAPGTIPPDEAATTQRTLELPAPAAGTHYLHIKARDGSGKWGPVTHYAMVQGG